MAFEADSEGYYVFNAFVYKKASKIYDLFCDGCVKTSKEFRKMPFLTEDMVPQKEIALAKKMIGFS